VLDPGLRYDANEMHAFKQSELMRAALTRIRQFQLPEPQSEFMFSPVGDWRLDLAYPEHHIGLELHGGTFSRGRHIRGQGFADDRRKMNQALLEGWRVYEFTREMISDELPRVLQVALAMVKRERMR
jgi:very-short-patch-repair endonuclease